MPTPPTSTPWVPLWPLQAPGATVGPMTLLSDVTIVTPTNVGADVAIPPGLKAIRVYVNGRSNAGPSDPVAIQFNNDGGANYDSEADFGVASTPGSAENLALNFIRFGMMPGTNDAASGPGTWVVDINDPSNPNFHKMVVASGGYARQLTTGNLIAQTAVGRWRNVAPITRMIVACSTGQFVAGSRITVYGIGDVVTQPAGIVTPVTIGTTLPASPADGQEAILVDSLTAPTYQWHFKYMAGIADANKWIFIGGAEARNYVGAADTLTSTTYANLTTVGPTVVVPRAGIYQVTMEEMVQMPASSGADSYTSVSIGAVAASDPNCMYFKGQAAGSQVGFAQVMRSITCNALAGDAIQMKYRLGAGSVIIQNRTLRVEPVRVA